LAIPGAGGAALSEAKAYPVLRDEINATLKNAMKARDQPRVSTLRLINSAFQTADLDAGGQGKPPLADPELLGVLQKMIKQRQESAEIYDKAGRPELAAQERGEIEIITAYLPKQMSDVEAGTAISAILQEINAQGMKDMGRVMAALKDRFTGKLDFAKASAKVKDMLKS
jgi:uncharacterized protein